MTTPVSLLSDAESQRLREAYGDSGFGALRTERGALPLRALDVRASISGLVAEMTLTQTFRNAYAEPLEATYVFPLPDRAAVVCFRMEVAGRVVEGTLRERGEARREYEEALQAGHRAAISEEERAGVFTLRVGNLMPGEDAKVVLGLVGPLAFDGGEATFRFPLVVAPRYIPGSALPGAAVGDGTAPDTDAVPDASRISPPVWLPGFPSPVDLSIAVDVEPSGITLGEARSSLHATVETAPGGGRRIALLPGERLDRDFILRFTVGGEAVETALALRADTAAGEPGGTFLLTVVPPARAAAATRPRDVVFVLDRSGSMEGWKMVTARRALGRMIDTLNERDRFSVLAFDNAIERPPGHADLEAATDRVRFRAIEFLAGIAARGGTEMAEPLAQAVAALGRAGAERDRIVVLVTDGQVGNEDQILRAIATGLAGMRVFTLGVDRAVNEGFLRRLATLGGGLCEVVESDDRLDQVMARVHERIATPVVSALRLAGDGLALEDDAQVPTRLPSLFAGAPLFAYGRYRGTGAGSVVLTGEDEAGRPWSRSVPAQATASAAVTALWARGRVRDLEDRYAIGARAEIEKLIVGTSLRFGVLSRFTAYVAVDRSEKVNPGGSRHRVIQPVEAPSGWDMRGGITGAFSLAMGGVRAAMAPAAMMRRDFIVADGEPGVMHELLGRAPGKRRPPEPMPAPPEVDLSAYRRRAGELRSALEGTSPATPEERLVRLGVLARRLAELTEDLRSVGAADAARPLEGLHVDLRKLLATPHPDRAEVERLWTRSLEVLARFAGDPGQVTGRKREGFWK